MNIDDGARALFGTSFCRKMELELASDAHARYARIAMASHDPLAAMAIRALLKEVDDYWAENEYLELMLVEQARGTE